MAILDYSRSLNAAGPTTMGQRTLQTAGMLQGLRQNEQTMQRQLNQDQAAQQDIENKAILSKEAQDVYARGNVNEIAEFSIANPIHGKNILAARGLVNAEDKTRLSDRFSSILTSTDPQETLQQAIAQGEANGLDMTQSKQILAQGLSPEGIKQAAGMALASIDGERFKDIQSAFSSGKDPKLSVEAEAFNDLIKDFTPDEQKLAKRVKAGLRGRAMSNAELSAIQSGEIKDYADWKARMKEQQKFAEMTGSSRAKKIDKGFDTIVKIDGAVRNIDRAIKAIKGGAGVGVLEKMWPSIKAASVELDNIRSSMALDVVGATTFGALSAGELALAKDVALPTGLDTDELLVYLDDRKAAQQKLRNYYNEQIQFLDQGGTVAGFLRSKEKGQQPVEDSNIDSQALNWAKSNPDDPRANAILKKQGLL